MALNVSPCIRGYDEPDKIVFSSTRSGTSEIYLMNEDGSEVIRLTYNDTNVDYTGGKYVVRI